MLLFELGPLGDCLQAVKEIELDVTARSREYENAIPIRSRRFPRLESDNQLVRDRDFALLVRLRSPASIRLVADANGGRGEVNVRPVGMHDFPLSHARH